MKIIFGNTWEVFFANLSAWSQLSIAARKYFLKITGDLNLPDRENNAVFRAEFQSCGFIEGDCLRLAPELRPLRRLMTSMHRHRVFNNSNFDLVEYCREHLTNADCITLCNSGWNPHWQTLRRMALDEHRLKSFIDCEQIETWEALPTSRAFHREACPMNDAMAAVIKQWLKRCLDGKAPLSFQTIAVEYAKNPELVSQALDAAIYYLLLFPALNNELEPVFGIIPEAGHNFNFTKPKFPDGIEKIPAGASVVAETPYLLNDITLLLVHTTPDGLACKTNGRIYKRQQDALAAELTSLPAYTLFATDRHARVRSAIDWSLNLKLIERSGSAIDNVERICITNSGRSWLTSSVGERLKAVLDTLLRSYRERLSRRTRPIYFGERHVAFASQSIHELEIFNNDNDPQKIVAESLGKCGTRWLPLDGFLNWQAEANNPFINIAANKARARFLIRDMTTSDKKRRWRDYVASFFEDRFFPLGCACLCQDDQGKYWFRLTPAGVYLIGASNHFDYEEPQSTGKILVQPNFEVVFTAANPAAESELARCAARVGTGAVGVVFHITRDAILNATDCGMKPEEIIAVLKKFSDKPLPANVATQINDWAASYRQVTIRPALLVSCPDKTTASLLQSMMRKKTSFINETTLEIEGKTLPELKKLLKKNGFGLREI